jgi:hypothetical protein
MLSKNSRKGEGRNGQSYYSSPPPGFKDNSPSINKIRQTMDFPASRNSLEAKLVCREIWEKIGGAEGVRTPDLLDAIEARSQLRHGPTLRKNDAILYSTVG